jgi:hypothetical protein
MRPTPTGHAERSAATGSIRSARRIGPSVARSPATASTASTSPKLVAVSGAESWNEQHGERPGDERRDRHAGYRANGKQLRRFADGHASNPRVPGANGNPDSDLAPASCN